MDFPKTNCIVQVGTTSSFFWEWGGRMGKQFFGSGDNFSLWGKVGVLGSSHSNVWLWKLLMDLSRNSGFSFVSPTSDNIQLAKGDNDNWQSIRTRILLWAFKNGEKSPQIKSSEMLHVLEHGTNSQTNQVIKSLGVERGEQSIRAPKNFHPFKGRKLHVIYFYLMAVLFLWMLIRK